MTHAYLGLAGYNALLLAVGYALSYGLGFLRHGSSLTRLAAVSYFGGWAAMSTGLTLGVLVGLDPGVLTSVAMAAVLIGTFLVIGRRTPRIELTHRHHVELVARVVSVLGCALLGFAVVVAVVSAARASADGSWDLFAFWLPKAEVIYYWHGLHLGAGGMSSFANAEYPPLMPTTSAAIFHFVGGFHPSLLVLQAAFLSAAFLGSLVTISNKFAPPWITMPLVALLAVTPVFWSRIGNVLPDQTVAYLLALALVMSIVWLHDRRRGWLALAVLFLAAAALTKREGSSLGLLLAFLVLFAAVATLTWKGLEAAGLLLGPAAVEPWHFWLRHHGLSTQPGNYAWHEIFNPSFLAARTGRLDYAFGWMVSYVFSEGAWLNLLPITLVALVAVFTRRPLAATIVFVWGLAGFLGLAAIYWIGVPDVRWCVLTSGNRVTPTTILVPAALIPLLLGLAINAAHCTCQTFAGPPAHRPDRVRRRRSATTDGCTTTWRSHRSSDWLIGPYRRSTQASSGAGSPSMCSLGRCGWDRCGWLIGSTFTSSTGVMSGFVICRNATRQMMTARKT